MSRVLSLAIVSLALGAAASTAGAVVIAGPGPIAPVGPIGFPGGPPRWGGPHPPIAIPAPEIDPASAIAGLTLLAGGLAVLRGRRRHNPKD